MTKEEFLSQLAVFRAEFVDEVIDNYQRNREKHGDISFERWSERFLGFLKRCLPEESKRHDLRRALGIGACRSHKKYTI